MGSGHFGAYTDVFPLQEALQKLPEKEAGLRGSASAILAEAHVIGFQPEAGMGMARQALALGRQTQDPRLCAHALVALALCQALRIQLSDALESLEEGLRQAHRSEDSWIEGWPLQRLPLVLNWMGRLGDAERRAEEACRQSRRTQDWAGYSLALAALTSVAVARGELAAAEDYAQQTLATARRSHYPWGAGMALPALAYAHGLRGEWAAAQRVSDVLMEPGSVFADAGPAFQFHTRVFRELLDALRATRPKGGEDLAIRALAAAPPGLPDNNLLAAFCPGVETAREIGDAKLAAACSAPIALAAERGMVFPSCFPFLLHRLVGVAAAMNESWEPAERYFRKAEAIATEIGARPELGRVYFDYSRMLAARSAEGDRTHAANLLSRASFIFDEFGMQPFLDQAAQLAAELGIRPPGSPQTSSEAATGSGLLPGEQSLQQVERAEEIPVVLLETDMEGSTALIDRVGDERAQAVKRTHDVILRACIRAYRGREIDFPGDGIMSNFKNPATAVHCAIAIQQDLARYNARHPDEPIRVRIAVHAGHARVDQDGLFGRAVNATARILRYAEPEEILISQSVRQRVEGEGEHFVLREWGSVPLKGLAERFHLHEVEWGNKSGA
jgi:class 3 adenylate cyclase